LRLVVLTLLLSLPALVDAGRGTLAAVPLAGRLMLACLIAAAAELLLAGVLGRGAAAPPGDETTPAAEDENTAGHPLRRRTDA
jgi:hypothetical protein